MQYHRWNRRGQWFECVGHGLRKWVGHSIRRQQLPHSLVYELQIVNPDTHTHRTRVKERWTQTPQINSELRTAGQPRRRDRGSEVAGGAVRRATRHNIEGGGPCLFSGPCACVLLVGAEGFPQIGRASCRARV